MIASLRGLAVLAAIAVILAIVVVADVHGDREPPDRALAPGLAIDEVHTLAWTRPGEPPVHLLRDGSGWHWEAPRGDADPRAVADVLATLRGARWHRRADATAAGAITTTLEVDDKLTIAAGDVLAGSEQQWLVTGDTAVLVDAWVARALMPAPIALRLHAPLANASIAKAITVAPDVELHGVPRRLGDMLVAPRYVDELERALAELAVVALPAHPTPAPPTLRIALDNLELVRDTGTCDGTVRARMIDGPHVGPGCVDAAAWRAVASAAAQLHVRTEAKDRAADLARLVERRPAPVDATQITLIDRSVLALARQPRIGDRDADPTRAAELLTILATPAETAPLPATAALGHLDIAARDQTITLDLYADDIVARHGEPIALRLTAGAYAILTRPGAIYRDSTVWREEPSTIHAITIAGTTYTRGAVLGEWTPGAGRAGGDGATLEALANLLGDLRERGDAPPPANPRAIELQVTPPAGAPTSHALVLGKSTVGCTATIDKAHVLVDPQLCALVDKLAKR